MKQLLALVVVLSLVSVLIGACGGSSAGTSSPAPTEVHMGQAKFVQSSVSISKGGSISLIEDVASIHPIANGTWQGSTPKPGAEAGAPPAKHLQFTSAGQRQTLGPFNTAGTFHYYCSVHQGMNLTVTVH